MEQLQPGTNHYTGVLTLEQVPAETYTRWDDDRWIIEAKHFAPYFVVDGQQRLTTIVILLQSLISAIGPTRQVNYTSIDEIRKKFIYESKDGGISRSFIFGYEKDNPSYEFLKTAILLERSDNHSIGEETIYTHNLHDAKEFLKNKLSEFSLPDLESLYTKVTQHLLFNVYSITSEIDVFVAFETMNNRGKPLSHLELLKNRLIFLSTKFAVDKEERSQLRRIINESWKTVYHYLGKNKDKPLDDDLFLSMHHWLTFRPEEHDEENPTARHYWNPNNEADRNFLLDSVFTVKNLPQGPSDQRKFDLTVQYIYDYAHNIKKAVKTYYEVWNPGDGSFSDEERMWIEKLLRIADPDEVMLIFAFYLQPAEQADRVKFLSVLEGILFISALAPYMPRSQPFRFARRAAQLSAKKQTVAQIITALNAHNEELRKSANFAAALKEWGKRSAYRWQGMRYFMFEYEQHLKSRSRTHRDKLFWQQFAAERYEEDYSTIEHVYPQKPTYDCWRIPFAQFSVKERNILRNCIGNLIPLSKPKNSSLGNKCFDEKKGSATSTVGYRYGCYSENEISTCENWTAEEIVDRTVKLLEFIEQRWQIQLGDRAKKIDLLGLDFVEKSRQKVLTALDELTADSSDEESSDDDEDA